MKKLNKTQIAKIQKLICTKSGAINKNLAYTLEVGIVRLMNGRPLHYMNEGSKGKRAYPKVTLVIAAQIVDIMGYQLVERNDSPRGGICGDHYLKLGNKVAFDWDLFVATIES